MNEYDSNKITYLQMVQTIIDRMSTTSAIFKGFCATVIAGISAISFTDINVIILFISLLPIICFFILDVYYLQLERRFRNLYNNIRNEKHEIDFDLTPPKANSLPCVETSIWYLIKSPSIFLFYFPIFLISIIVILIKIKNI